MCTIVTEVEIGHYYQILFGHHYRSVNAFAFTFAQCSCDLHLRSVGIQWLKSLRDTEPILNKSGKNRRGTGRNGFL